MGANNFSDIVAQAAHKDNLDIIKFAVEHGAINFVEEQNRNGR